METTLKKSPIGQSWDEFEKEIFSPEELALSDQRIQRYLASLSQVVQIQSPTADDKKENEKKSEMESPI